MKVQVIEELLLALPNVQEVCVLVINRPGSPEGYHAFVVLQNTRPDTDAQFHQSCKDKLAKDLIGVTVQVLQSLPRTPTGAISRRELAAISLSSVA